MEQMSCKNAVRCEVLAVALVLLPLAGNGVEYNPPIDLGSFGLGQDQAWAYSINNHGEVVGQAYAPDGMQLFLWTPEGGMRHIRDTVFPVTVIEYVGAINDAGQVVGWNYEDGIVWRSRAVLYDGQDVREMVTVGTYYALPYSVNNVGQAAGKKSFQNRGVPAVFDIAAGTVAEIAELQGSEGAALSVNDEGQIVGYYEVSQGSRPFLCEKGTAVDLGTFGRAWDINSEGQIVGETETEAFLYENGACRNIAGRAAYAVNDAGQIVGYSGTRAVLWTADGGMIDIHPQGWQSSKAKDINNRGWVVGDGKLPDGRNRAFLLVPAADVVVSLKLTPEGLRLVYQVPWESTYQLQASTDLSTWRSLSEVVSPMRCILRFPDPSAPGLSHRFYRLEVLTQ